MRSDGPQEARDRPVAAASARGQDVLVERTEPHYTKAADGTHVAYSVMGEGQVDVVYAFVKDRERWFNVVMGEKLELDEASTDRISARAPLPSELARTLSLRLEVR
jgi:hypothetical protein